MKRSELEREIDRLYSLPRGEFTAARNELAKRLRGDSKQDAERVKALKKPSVVATAINRAAQADPPAADALSAAAEELVAAQEALLEGDRSRLDRATAVRDEAIERMLKPVEKALDDEGSASASNLDRARETLRAATVDSEIREQLAAGRLLTDHRAAGLTGPGSMPSATTRRTSDKPATARTSQKRRRAAERKLELAAERAREAEEDLQRTDSALAEAQANHERAQRKARKAMAELARAQQSLNAAKDPE